MKIPHLEMRVRVSDGSYESQFTIPVDASKAQIETVAAMWIDALRKAVEITRDSVAPKVGGEGI